MRELVLLTGINYSPLIIHDYYKFAVTNPIETNHLKISVEQLKIPVGIRYAFAMKQYNPFLSAGISKNYLISQKTSRHQELEYYDYVERRFYEFDDRLDKKNWSMWEV
jgi:hypothetical protein